MLLSNIPLLSISLTLISLCTCFHNPGVIVQIPTNYSLPIIALHLPQSIPPIVIENLQLNNIQVREVVYSWKYLGDRFVMLLERSSVSFDWKYGKTWGVGTFVEEYSDLVIYCSFDVDKDYRFKIDIDGAKITNQDKRHSIKINLGGNVPETVVVIVTNLILNHAKTIFRSAIKLVVAKAVQAFTQPLRKDVQIICKQAQKKQECIYINTTLVGKPLISQNIQIIQINGAPYRTGHHSGYLDPSDALFKVNSSQINVQLHKQIVTRIATLYNQISAINFTINSTEISSVTDIDSQTLSVVFPKMRDYDPRPVIMNIVLQSITALLNDPPYFGFLVKGILKVETQKQTVFQPYINKAEGTAIVKIQPIIVGSSSGARIHKINITQLQINPLDIQSDLIRPDQVMKHIETLMQWAEGGINGDLNTRKKVLEFANLELLPKIKFLTNSANVEIGFVSKVGNGMGVGKEIYIQESGGNYVQL